MFLLCSHAMGIRNKAKEAGMARIKKDDHPRILRLVDVERRTVREIAAEFGCTPAAIYALLTKLRRQASVSAPDGAEAQPPLALEEEEGEEAEVAETPPVPAPSLSAPSVSPPPEERKVVTFERVAQLSAPRPAAPQPAAPQPAPPGESPRAASATLGAKLAKPGMGLVMRTADGEETMTPFRSVDDLLSAIKPILRAGARSPEPVWFSLQPVDLSAIDVDAA
jgi:transposase-like protein